MIWKVEIMPLYIFQKILPSALRAAIVGIDGRHVAKGVKGAAAPLSIFLVFFNFFYNIASVSPIYMR